MAKYSNEKIIEQFREIHGDLYDYSLLEYQGDKSKVKIICRKHGVFTQWVSGHKKGSGCRQCALNSLKPKYTTEQIIEQFKKKHGDRFDYSLVDYKKSTEKIKIICKKHGVFEQLPGMHRKGQGCAQCMYDGKRLPYDKVIQEFQNTHGLLYDYALVEYENIDQKVKISCATHGVFEQSPWHHMRGDGCPKCVGKYSTSEEILKSFREVHGDRYDYSQVDFKYKLEKVKIICREHGIFEQKPQKHILGNGCAKCGGTELLSTEEIIDQFKLIHGELYDYSHVEYVNSKTKVKIKCSKHGLFEQTPGSHKAGAGCPICAGNNNLKTFEVIKQFKVIHGDRYDYSRVVYERAFGEVEIICKEHGAFFQIAKTHKKGSGCPQCAITIDHTKQSYINLCKAYANGTSYLYVIQCFDENEIFYKVGISYYGAKLRFNSKGKMPYKFKILKEIKGNVESIWDFEKKLHKLLSQFKFVPNKPFNGASECFSQITPEVERFLANFDC